MNENIDLAKVAKDAQSIVKAFNDAAKAVENTTKGMKTIVDLFSSWSNAAKAVDLYTNAVKASESVSQLLLKTMNAQQLAVGVLTGEIKLAEAATAAWQIVITAISNHPYITMGVAVAAVTVALIALNSRQDETVAKTKEITAATKEQQEAWEEANAAQQARLDLVSIEASETGKMIEELERLVDADGKVGENKERVGFLMEKINELFPESIQWIDEETVAVENNIDALKRLAKLKEAQAIADELAIENAQRQLEIEESIQKQLETQADLDEAHLKREELIEEKRKALTDGQRNSIDEKIKLQDKHIAALEESMEIEKGIVSEKAAYLDYYKELEQAIYEENMDEVGRILQAMNLELVDLNKASVEELEDQRVRLSAQYDLLCSDYADSTSAYIVEMRADLKKILDETEKEIKGRTVELGDAMVTGIATGSENKRKFLGTTLSSILLHAIEMGKKAAQIKSPSKVAAREIGSPLVEGIAAGVENDAHLARNALVEATAAAIAKTVEAIKGTSKLYDAVEVLSKGALQAAKSKGNSYKEIGSLYVQQMTVGINEKRDQAIEQVKKLIDDQLEAVEQEHRAAEKRLEGLNTKAAKAQLKELQEQNAETEKALKEWGTSQIQAYTEAVRDGAEDSIAHISQAIGAVADAIQDKYDEIMRSKEAMEQKLSSFGDLYLIDNETNQMSLANIEDQIDAMKQYEDALTQLKDLGVSDEFMAQVTAMSMEDGTRFAETLLALGAEDFDAYVQAWEEKQALAKEVAARFYKDELDALEREFVDNLGTALSDVPKSVEHIGRNAMQGFQEGMESQRGALIATARSIADQVKSILQSAFEINSPSRWAKRVIGQNVVKGMGLGMTEGMDDLFLRMKKTVDLEAGKLTTQFVTKTEYQSAQDSSAQRVQTVFQNNTVEKTPVVQFKGELAALARVMTPHIVTEIHRQGSSFISKEGLAGV